MRKGASCELVWLVQPAASLRQNFDKYFYAVFVPDFYGRNWREATDSGGKVRWNKYVFPPAKSISRVYPI